MKIHRIRLKNFAGVDDSEVTFAAPGVTVVDGPNEIGKSSLFQALDLLLDHLDTSTRREVVRARPVHRDAGAEVEADLEVGEYRFTYLKRFHKDRQTRLAVQSPRPENLTGREAHDRVKQILETSMDAELWKALRIVQGEGIDLPDLRGQPALAHALDLAAGEVQSDDSQHDLLDIVRNEFLRYWTEGGREKQDPIGNARKAEADSRQEFEDLYQKLKELESEVSRYSDLIGELVAVEKSVGTTATALKALETSWSAVSKIATGVELLEAEHRTAAAELDIAVSAEQERKRLIEAAENQATVLKHQSDQISERLPRSEKAATELALVEGRWRSAREASQQAESALRLRRNDRDFRNNELVLAQMTERLERIRLAERAAADAVILVAGSTVTTELRDSIRDAEIEVKKAQALLNAASPTVKITPLQETDIFLNEVEFRVPLGESQSTTAAEPINLRIGELAVVNVSPGTGESDLQETLVASQSTLTSLCTRAGVVDLDEAERALASRNEADRTIQERDRLVNENLRDLTRENLEQRIRQVQANVEAYGSRRADVPQISRDLDEASEWLSTAESLAEQRQQELDDVSDEHDTVRDRLEEFNRETAVAQALTKQAREDSERVDQDLARAREKTADDQVVRGSENAQKTVDSVFTQLDSAKTDLEEADPEGTSLRLKTARAAHETAKERHTGTRAELTGLRARLDALGEQGLSESVASAERDYQQATDESTRVLRRARAAKLLFETLSSERDAAQRQYVGPLRERVQLLGKYIFGQSFDIEINDQLQVAHRTLDGVTLPYINLSTGAREQIGVLMRLAAAILADSAGGVPVVLDDTLGSTDRSRLEGAGVAISVAARNCQVILLTSMPERYQHIDVSRSVRLS